MLEGVLAGMTLCVFILGWLVVIKLHEIRKSIDEQTQAVRDDAKNREVFWLAREQRDSATRRSQ